MILVCVLECLEDIYLLNFGSRKIIIFVVLYGLEIRVCNYIDFIGIEKIRMYFLMLLEMIVFGFFGNYFLIGYDNYVL